MIHTLFNE